MKKSTIVLIAIIGILLLSIGSLFGTYNGFMSAEEDVDNKYSQIENQLQRRTDLIPNLVNTVQGYVSHESDVMKAVAEARAQMLSAETPSEKAEADARVTTALRGLMGYTENYPDLKADKQFTALMDELAGTENRIAVSRKDYNDEVTLYNKKIKRMPGALVANMFGFDEKEQFKAAEGAEVAPTVDFNSNGESK